ncbi:MAG TPA: hypothetical protein VHX12_13675, partial [Acidisoma sp.]|nr:hypothetical protein [Acidisoma sp.]
MDEVPSDPPVTRPGITPLATAARSVPPAAMPRLTEAGRAALAEAAALARKASAPATLRAYKSDWMHYAWWCARMGFVPVPAEPATVGAY